MEFFKELFDASNEKEKLYSALQVLPGILSAIESLQGETLIGRQYWVDRIKNQVLELEEVKEYKDILSNLEYKTEDAKVKIHEYVTDTLEKTLKEKEADVSRIEEEIATFKSHEGLLESTPQTLLQSSRTTNSST